MTLAPGTRLGPYEIIAPLGAGGMGEVYRATDTRLGRVVAIKVLPAHLADDPARRERFEREARAVSALNHPHICTLHDIGSQEVGGRRVDFLVMEHLEGESLADRLAKGPLPPDEVLRHGIDIADALDRAHRQGIVHRDLKPGNIMLTRGGAKLLDFGLAKLHDAGPGAGGSGAGPSGGSILPTTTRNLTAEGAIVGTFQYMAPEQLEGKETDARTDIFAFGAVLYEMATGRRAFEGQSQASLIASILKEQPRPIADAQPLAPSGLDRVVRTCLAKDPDDRIQSGHDVRLQLEWVLEGTAPQAGTVSQAASAGAAARVTRASGVHVWQAAAGLLLLATAVLAYLHFGPAPAAPERPALHFTIQQPPKIYWRPWNSMALSPDGTKLAFYADGEDGGRLFLRSFGDVTIKALPGTDQGNASFPFWSPDSRTVAFFASGKLKRIDIAGGPPTAICDVADGRGGTWAPDGTIIFSPSVGSPLVRVKASGGTPEPVTDYDAADPGGHLWPNMLPDGRHFTFIASGAVRSESWLMLGEVGSRAVRRLWMAESGAQYAPPGYLLFMRGNTLFAQPFDAHALAARGDPAPIVEGVSRNTDSLFAAFSASGDGTLVYKTGSDLERQMGIFGRDGHSLGRAGPLGDIGNPELSPDGTRLAVDRIEPNALDPDIWVIDLKRNTGSRFTFEADSEHSPAWSPDGQTIYYVARRNDRLGLYAKPADGGAGERLVVEGDGTPWTSSQVTRDGAWFVFARGTNTGDIWIASMKGGAAPHAYMETPYSEMRPQVSPDNRWIAYESDESGRSEVYIQTFPHPGGKWQVSTSGGVQPRWRADTKELYFFALDRTLMAVPLAEKGGGITPGTPTPILVTGLAVIGKYRYTVSPDGQRFYLAEGGEDQVAGPFDVVLNWAAMLRGR